MIRSMRCLSEISNLELLIDENDSNWETIQNKRSDDGNHTKCGSMSN